MVILMFCVKLFFINNLFKFFQNVECVKEVKKYILEKTNNKIGKLFEEDSHQIGLLLNERFINIPPQVSVPLLENLW